MKVALCFSGQMRNVEQGYVNHIKPNIIDPNSWDHEIDVFVHTWFDVEDIGKGYEVGGNKEVKFCTPTPGNVIDSMFKLYNPKKALVERQRKFNIEGYRPHRIPYIVPFATLSKCWSMKEVNALKNKYEEEAKQVYDLVLQLRFDLSFSSPIIFNDINPRAYTTSSKADHAVDVCKGFCGSREADIVMNLYDYMDSYWKKDNVEFIDEELMRHHLDKHGIKIIHNKAMTDCDFLR